MQTSIPPAAVGLRRIELGRLIDGCGSAPVLHAAVLIEDDRIVEIGPASTVSRPESAQVFEFHNATAVPGFIDCHAHMTMPGDGTSVEAVGKEDERISTVRAAENGRLCLKTGVTTVFDCGAPGTSMFALKEAAARRVVPSPRLCICGRPLTATGGHGWPFGGEVDGADGMRGAVRQLAKEGADFIKIMVSGGSTRTTNRYRVYLWNPELQAAVDEAHAWGRLVVAHATSVLAITACLDLGVDVIAHGTFYGPRSKKSHRAHSPSAGEDFGQFEFDPRIAERIADQAIPVVPTLWTNLVRVRRMEQLAGERELSALEIAELDRRRRTYEERCENMNGLIAAGVTLGAGTDAGWGPPFGTFHEEIVAMSQAGLGLSKAILAATRDAARIFGIDDALGTLERGKFADLVLMDGDPTRDESALQSITAVFRGGARVG